MSVSRNQLKLYREVITMWLAKFDTLDIATALKLPEPTVARWVANFRDLAVGAAA